MKYLIDTNICIYIMNKRPVAVINRFKQHNPGDIGISAISVSELRYGAAKSLHSEKNQLRVNDFLVPFEILPFDADMSVTYGQIRVELEKKGIPIGPLDMFIAAHALYYNLILITNNEKEFMRVNRLKVENWVE